jgi:hypothetical protein
MSHGDVCLCRQRWSTHSLHVRSLNLGETGFRMNFMKTLNVKKKVKQSRYTPWRRLGGEEV